MTTTGKLLRQTITICSFGALVTACAPTPSANVTVASMETRVESFPPRSTLLPPSHPIASNSTSAKLKNSKLSRVDLGSNVSIDQQHAKSFAEERDNSSDNQQRDTASSNDQQDSFDGVDVASASDTGSSSSSSAGGGGNTTTSAGGNGFTASDPL